MRSKRNLVQSQLFSEKLKKTLNAYHNRAITTREVVEELITRAKAISAADSAAKRLALTQIDAGSEPLESLANGRCAAGGLRSHVARRLRSVAVPS